MVNTLTQNSRTKTYTLDPADRILTTADTAGPTLTNHYTDTSDNPGWIAASDGTWTRYVDGASGGLGISVDNAGTVHLQLSNLHGDTVATSTPADTGPATYAESTEYGLPRDPTTPTARYGWLGSNHRNTGDALAQLTLMGARLYNPTTGRFLSVDPEPGGSANDYDYCSADPINCTDLDGKWPSWHSVRHWAWQHKWDIIGTAATFVPVAGEVEWAYRGYRMARFARTGYESWRAGRSLRRISSGVRYGGRKYGWSLRYDRKWHNFHFFGHRVLRSHIQFDRWRIGVKGSHRSIRMPLPWSRGPR